MSYSVYLPNYSIGENCYKELPYVARNYGKKAVVIGGKTAMEKAKDALLEGIKGSDLEITDFIWYGGDSSYENGNALIAESGCPQRRYHLWCRWRKSLRHRKICSKRT